MMTESQEKHNEKLNFITDRYVSNNFRRDLKSQPSNNYGQHLLNTDPTESSTHIEPKSKKASEESKNDSGNNSASREQEEEEDKEELDSIISKP